LRRRVGGTAGQGGQPQFLRSSEFKEGGVKMKRIGSKEIIVMLALLAGAITFD